MGKAFIADVIGEQGVRCLVADGKMLKFHFNGTCLGDFPVSYNLASMQEVELISLLVTGNKAELGFNVGQVFTKKEIQSSLADINNTLSNIQGLIFVGMKQGVLEEVSYYQYLYAFIRGAIRPDMIA